MLNRRRDRKTVTLKGCFSHDAQCGDSMWFNKRKLNPRYPKMFWSTNCVVNVDELFQKTWIIEGNPYFTCIWLYDIYIYSYIYDMYIYIYTYSMYQYICVYLACSRRPSQVGPKSRTVFGPGFREEMLPHWTKNDGHDHVCHGPIYRKPKWFGTETTQWFILPMFSHF